MSGSVWDPSWDARQVEASLRARLKNAATQSGRPVNELEREFVLQRFLARVFAEPDSPWILKGGTALLCRVPGARHTRDIDLLHPAHDLRQAVQELTALGDQRPDDPFTFRLTAVQAMGGAVQGAQVKVDVMLGERRFAAFPIDVSTQLEFVGQVERQRPRSTLDFPGLSELPPVTLYPLPDQVADKIHAMYEVHGPDRRPSSRYRDLADLALITDNFPLDAAHVRAALDAEGTRRGLDVPNHLAAPGPDWARGYADIARGSALPTALHDLPTALEHVGQALNPILEGRVTTSTWDPITRSWADHHPATALPAAKGLDGPPRDRLDAERPPPPSRAPQGPGPLNAPPCSPA